MPGGRNIGTNFGHGRVIAGLDNDAVFASPDTLTRMVAAFDANADPDLGAVACRIVVDSTGRDDLSSWGYPRALLPQAQKTFGVATFVGAGHAIRREAWADCRRLRRTLVLLLGGAEFLPAGDRSRFWRVLYRGDIVVRHKVSPERRIAWPGDRWFHYVRNRIYIGRKYGQS